MARIAAALIALALAGCAERVVEVPRPVEVMIPVPTRALPPAELLNPLPAFRPGAIVDKGSPAAVVGMTATGLEDLRLFVEAARRRLDALRAWSAE